MSGPAEVPKIAERLRSASSAIRCHELTDILTSLGFEVRDGRKAGHKVFVHQGIAAFTSAGFPSKGCKPLVASWIKAWKQVQSC